MTRRRSVAAAESPPFITLRERAAALLATAELPLADADLARALLGTATGGRWTAVLDTVLGGDARFERGPDGWRLARAGTHPTPVPDDYGPIVTLALATTGADPTRHRVLRLAAVRRAPDGTLARLDLLVNPNRRLPRYLTAAARLQLDDLDGAPDFAAVVPRLGELVGDHPVYVYGAAWAGAFLDAEHARAGLPRPAIRLVEIDDLARPHLPAGRKPGLVAAAAALGITHPRPGYPLADAEVAARVVALLRGRQPSAPSNAPHGSAGSVALPFPRAWLATVPSEPGVYVVEDANGAALYVGKAVNLRRRLAAYAGPAPALHRRLEALAVRARRVSVLPAPSDLEATLLESRLIAERQPVFNVARRVRDARAVIRAAPHEPTPRVQLVAAAQPDGASYFGPFRSVSAAQRALAVARAAYPAAFGRRVADLEARRAAVLAVCRLLGGQKGPALDTVRAAMAASAAAGDAARVQQLWQALRAVQDLDLQLSDLAGLSQEWGLLAVERRPDRDGRAHLIRQHRLLGSTNVPDTLDLTDPEVVRGLVRAIATDLGATPGERPGASDPAEPAIVRRWLSQAGASVTVARVAPDLLAELLPERHGD